MLRSILVVIGIGVFSLTSSATILMEIPNIPGDSILKGYEDWIVLESFSAGVEREIESGGRGGTQDLNIGIGNLRQIEIEKSTDRSSTQLWQYAINGASFNTAEIHFLDFQNQNAFPYMAWKIDRGFVGSFDIRVNGDDRPVEDISLYFNRIAFGYYDFDNGETLYTGWDNVKNVPWKDHGLPELGPGNVNEIVLGDVDQDGIVDVKDIDILSDAVFNSETNEIFDLNSDGLVNQADRLFWITELQNTWVGDSNLDGEFNSGDLIDAFQAGQYEDDTPNNSSWGTGDWNGDGDFESRDLIVAFQDGGYERGLRDDVIAVPEPCGQRFLIVWVVALVFVRQRSTSESRD